MAVDKEITRGGERIILHLEPESSPLGEFVGNVLSENGIDTSSVKLWTLADDFSLDIHGTSLMSRKDALKRRKSGFVTLESDPDETFYFYVVIDSNLAAPFRPFSDGSKVAILPDGQECEIHIKDIPGNHEQVGFQITIDGNSQLH